MFILTRIRSEEMLKERQAPEDEREILVIMPLPENKEDS